MASPPVRLNVFRSSDEIVKRCGKVMVAGPTLEATLKLVSDKYGEKVLELQTVRGSTIDDLTVLRDWDYVIAMIKGTESEEPHSSPHTPLELDSVSISSAPSSNPPTPDLNRDRGEANARVREPTDFSLRRTTLLSTPEAPSRNDWVRLNVGGKIFATTRATLTSDSNSMLARMFESSGWLSATDSTGAYLIDRSPDYFEPLLNFLRHGKLLLNEGINPQGVLEEAKFFGISKATERLEGMVATEELSISGHFTRKEFLRMLSITSSSTILRCQGINMEGVDLSNLDLRNINFKCATLRGCNLSNSDLTNCVFERADLTKATLDNAVIQCVHMPRVNLEGATLKGCSMDERLNKCTNLEGANLKGINCDNSQMNGVNFRLASLKGASLRSCNLRHAIMAGTDLEDCDLEGSDLQHANLRGANIEGTNFQDVAV
ncbi:BTB/POZ domain-containing protein KCTD9-like isoform X2 [Halichondria panicea]|uniref:BTB/POZ domain-containing protein KCTD9-like isoform X2 n=1 Tax=Halichondria panicea TaxID=6063 RepID=UPI00312B9907